MQLYYSADLNDKIFVFDARESKHIIRVMRHHSGDMIHVTDGKGNIFRAKIINEDASRCMAEITEPLPSFDRHNYYLHIALAPPKNPVRMEWFVEKTVEVGIDEITPLICHNSERKKINGERLHRIALAAMKQSLKLYATRINESIHFDNLIKEDFEGRKYIACLDSESKTQSLAGTYAKGENALILIGPEGDFTTDEMNRARDNDYLPVSLGNSRLRTETAGITACCWIYFANQ
ncbi:MAG: 16S rRNA (uracil(1498)-N(3))-methyltransferase [Bacteroidales bacterium]|nr:16S rRNA (uracil(1498)-N(3))-methyltransferase [Bacteroidales bacterium]